MEVEGLPTVFGPKENLRWSTEVSFGRSSPVLTDSVVYLTGSDDDHLIVACLDRKTGALRWQKELKRARVAERYSGTDSSAPSPVTDGKNVYAFFQELGLVSFDEKGEQRWLLPMEAFNNHYGQAASLVLAGDTLIVPCDAQTDSFLLAVGKDDGKPRWRVNRGLTGESWSTPVLYPSAAEAEIVLLFGSRFVHGYSLTDGKELVSLGKVGSAPVISPVLYETMLFVCAPFHAEQGWAAFDAVLAGMDKDGDGKLNKEEVAGQGLDDHFGWLDVQKDGFIDRQEWDAAGEGMSDRNYGLVAFDLSGLEDGETAEEMWRHTKSLPDIATPLFYRDVLYMVKEGGIVTALDPVTGEVTKRERLPDCSGPCYPSPVAGDGKVFIASNTGKVVVLKASSEWEVLAVNDLQEEINATPAIGADGSLFIRTSAALHCFAGEGGSDG